MEWLRLTLLFAMIMAAVLWEFARRRRLDRFTARRCAGRSWREAFPDVPKRDIRAFLKAFVEAFILPGDQCLTFQPGDRLLEIYKACVGAGPDSFEFEELDRWLKNRSSASLNSLWHEHLTLGEVFAASRAI